MVNSALETDIRTINYPSISCNISKPKEIVVIDQSIDDYQILIDHVRSGIAVHLLNAQQDGILQLTEILRQHTNLDALHIVSHGNAGHITLGNSVLSTATLKKYQQALFTWQAALNHNSDILIYGCNVGKGKTGFSFVKELATITSCNIAASHNLTGFNEESADWNLTIEAGHIQSAIAFNHEIITAYKGTLATQVENFNTDPNFAGGFATSFTLNGFTYTFTGDGEGGDFAWQNNIGVGSTGGIKPDSGAGVTPTNTGTAERFTIAKSDASDFVFNSIRLWSDTQSVTVTGKLNGSTVGTVTLGADNSQLQQAAFVGGATVVDVLEISSVDFDIGGPDAFDDFSYDLVVNASPTISIDNAALSYTEGDAATQIDSAATVSDADGDADWDGGTLEVQTTLNAEGTDTTSISDTDGDGTAITISGTNIFANGVDIGDLNASGGTVTGATKLTITFDSDATNANVQEVLQSIRFISSSENPGTSRTVTFTATDKNSASSSDTRTISITRVNDEPTLTATSSNPTFTEGGAAASLFSGASASTIEGGQDIQAMTMTVTNLADGSNERLNVDGATIILTHGTNGTTATNNLNYSVSVVGSTATVSLTGGTMSTAATQTMVNAMSYQNNSNTPNTSNRVVTITAMQDSGGTANGGDNTVALSIASTVTMVQNNDEPTLTATGSNPTFTEGGAAASLFSGTSISTVESGQTIKSMTLTVTNLANGINERLNLDGSVIVLTHGTSGTTATNSLSYAVTVVGSTATVALTGGTMSTAATQTLVNAISYQNTSNDPSTSNRVVTITSVQDSGGTANGGDDTAALAVASTVTVVGVNDEPSLTATGSNSTFTEGGAAASLFSGASASTIESGQTLSALTLTVTNVNDGSNEILNTDGTAIVLTHGTSGTTATNSLSYSVTVAGTTATVTLSGGTMSTAATQTLIDALSYQNNSNTPNTSNRVITITSMTDSGGTANGGDNTAALAIASTVTVVGVNDEPSLTATGSNPTFTEGGAAASLFSSTSVSTIESGQTLSALTLTVTNVNDGSNEILNTDGTAIVLTHGTSGTTTTNSLSYSVSVVGTTATISLTGGTLSTAATQTLVNAISYQNNSNSPNTSNRVVTITSLKDNGGTANGGDDTAALSISSTVTVDANPKITSATYDYNNNHLVVTGINFVAKTGAANDVDVSLLTVTGEGGATYTLTSATDVEIDSTTQFTVTLTGADLTHVESLLNRDGTASDDGTTFNLAAADNWMTQTSATPDISDATNAITVSNYAVPTITSATYDVSTGQLVITGTNFVSQFGATNDLDASLLTITGDWGSYALTDTSDVDITSATSATLTLSTIDQLNVNGLLNKNGTTSGGAVTYNLAAADNWLTGAPAANDISDTTGNGITVSNVAVPNIVSAVYDAPNHNLLVTGTNFFKNPGANNDIDASKLTMIGGDSASYNLQTTANVEITSATSFTVHVSNGDDSVMYGIYNQLGTQSSFGTVYDIQTIDNWLTAVDASVNISGDTAEGGVNVTINPMFTASTYNATTGVLVVTGSNFEADAGGDDIDVSQLTFTGEGGGTYTLTDSADVELDSTSQFTVTLSATDKAAVNLLLNKIGTSSVGGTTYNLSAADDWCACPSTAPFDISDTSGISVSNVPVPAITSATYDANSGALVVTGSGFLNAGGATNDIIANTFTFTGEGGETYTLTDTANVDITSSTAFTLTLSATDKAAVNQIINKDGTTSTSGTTYNLAAAEDWAAGADAAVNIVDATGNGITASNVATPTITSATYNTGTGVLAVTGTGLPKLTGTTNDIDASLLTLTGLGGGTYTLTDTADVDITSATAFTLTLSATDKAAVNALLNTNGTTASDATTYNLAAAEDWAAGADAAVNVADATGNGITVTVVTPPSGGGGGGAIAPDPTETPIVTTETVDGVTVSKQTESDGSTTLTVSIIDSTRIDEPDTLSETHADIPILINGSGDPILTVSLPIGVGLTVNGQAEPMNTQDAITDLVQRIEQTTTTDSETLLNMTVHGQDFIASLAADEIVSVQTITPLISDTNPPGQPIIITGSDFPGGGKLALIIDASNLPSGTVIQLDNVAFAAITGAVRVVGGAGENFVVGDHQNQFIVLGADDDILFGGGGDDTIGSLGGNDQTHGDDGNDVVYGGAGHDILSGGAGNDALNGGLGFDIAVQAGRSSDYAIQIDGNHVTLTHNDGVVDVLTDIELIQFETGPNLAVAYSGNEAVAHHLAKTWLGRDLTTTEVDAMQNWSGTDVSRIVDDFLNLPEAVGLQQKTTDELLAGLNDNPDILRLDSVRNLTGGNSDNQGYLPLGLALNVDGGGGHDVLKMHGGREDVHLERINDSVEITRLEDGAMLSLRNVEMIAFDSGENVLLAHNQVEGILGRLFQTFFDRDATIGEWQLGRKAIADHVNPKIILDWFQNNSSLNDLDNTDYIQALYSQTFGRSATETELNQQQLRLENGEITREWLAVDVANSNEAVAVIGSVILLDEGL